MKSQAWFIKNIGKIIFRDKSSCTCEHCADTVKNGLLVANEQHAKYLYSVQCDFHAEGTDLNFRLKK